MKQFFLFIVIFLSFNIFSNPLISVIKKSDENRLQRIIDKNLSYINESDKNGNIPLHTAVINKASLDLIQLLIEKGANVNKLDRAGYSPLMLAIFSNKIDTVNLLIENDADLNYRLRDNSVLIYALKNGNVDICNLILKNGAKTTTMDTPVLSNLLTQNIELNNYNLVSILLFLDNLDINYKNSLNQSALLIEASKPIPNKSVITTLLEKKAVLTQEEILVLSKLFLTAVSNNDFVKINLLFELGIDINFRDEKGAGALSLELSKSSPNLELIYNFSQAGIIANEKEKIILSDIMLEEIQKDSTQYLNTFLKLGVDINYSNKEKTSALLSQFVKENPNMDIINILITDGAKIIPEEKIFYNQRFIDFLKKNRLELIDTLLSLGVDVNYLNQYKENAIIVEAKKDSPSLDIIEKIKNSGYKENQFTKEVLSKELIRILEKKDFDKLSILLNLNADINYKTSNGSSILLNELLNENPDITFINYLKQNGAGLNNTETTIFNDKFLSAIKDGNIRSVRNFISLGANPNYVSRTGDKPLVVAVKNGIADTTIIDYLLNAKAVVTDSDKKIFSEFLYKAVEENKFSLVPTLINLGANINYRNKNKISVLMLEILKPTPDKFIIESLKKFGAKLEPEDGIKLLDALISAIMRKDMPAIEFFISVGVPLNSPNVINALLYNFSVSDLVKIDSIANSANEKLLSIEFSNDNPNIDNVNILASYNNTSPKFKGELINVFKKFVLDKNNIDIFPALVKLGLNINARIDGSPLLLLTLKNKNNNPIIKKFIEAGANIHLKDSQGKDALIVAAQYNNEEIVKLLLKNGANVKVKDNKKQNALFYSLDNSDNKTTIALLAEKSDISGITVNDIAFCNDVIIEAFIKAGIPLNFNTSDPNFYSVCRAVVKIKGDKKFNRYGWTNLMIAILQNKPFKTIKNLIDTENNYNKKDSVGWNALLFELISPVPSFDVINALVLSGADVNAYIQEEFVDDNGNVIKSVRNSVLYYALVGSKTSSSIIKLLIETGADVQSIQLYQENQNGLWLETPPLNFARTKAIKDILIASGATIN